MPRRRSPGRFYFDSTKETRPNKLQLLAAGARPADDHRWRGAVRGGAQGGGREPRRRAPWPLSLVLAPLATELPKAQQRHLDPPRQGLLAVGNVVGAMAFQSTVPIALAWRSQSGTWSRRRSWPACSGCSAERWHCGACAWAARAPRRWWPGACCSSRCWSSSLFARLAQRAPVVALVVLAVLAARGSAPTTTRSRGTSPPCARAPPRSAPRAPSRAPSGACPRRASSGGRGRAGRSRTRSATRRGR